jgi:hypothetical protein
MSYFFDFTDLSLIHSDVREHPELPNVIDRVEWEILDAFSQRDLQGLTTVQAFFEYETGRDPGDEILVRLSGYNQVDPPESEDGLKEALRRTIATVASELMRSYEGSRGVQSVQQGQRAVTYGTQRMGGSVPTWTDWPSGWDRFLKNYDARIKPYGI